MAKHVSLIGVASFADIIRDIREYVFLELTQQDGNPAYRHLPSSPSSTTAGEADWDAEWGWSTVELNEDEPLVEDARQEREGSPDEISEWLERGCLSISPLGDVMAVANGPRLLIASVQYEPMATGSARLGGSQGAAWETPKASFRCCFKGDVTREREPDERVTSLLCLPIVSRRRTSEGLPDMTCVIVGLSSGYLRVYMEAGTLLLSQLFHVEPVLQVRCVTYAPPAHVGCAEPIEELSLLYPSALVLIDGFSLVQTLRACKNQAARSAAETGGVYQVASSAAQSQTPPLAYHKWLLRNQESVAGHSSCGFVTPTSLDLMSAESLLGHHQAAATRVPGTSSLYITTGTSPFVGLYYAALGSSQQYFSDVAYTVANKLKSAVFSRLSNLSSVSTSWLRLKSTNAGDTEKSEAPYVEPGTSLPLRFGLPDKQRAGTQLALSPKRDLLVTADTLGRVVLVDVAQGIMLRIWKGYREAQVAWISTEEAGEFSTEQLHKSKNKKGPSPPTVGRIVQFLVIYAPRRGLLEIWPTVQGPRVAAINVSRYCRLLSLGYGCMGTNSATWVPQAIFQCFLLHPDGRLHSLQVPFHAALSTQGSKQAQDQALAKQVQACLKDADHLSPELEKDVVSLISQIASRSLQQDCLERVLATHYVTAKFALRIFDAVCAQFESDAVESGRIQSKILLQYRKCVQDLLHMYEGISSCQRPSSCHVTNSADCLDNPASEPVSLLMNVLKLTESEATSAVKTILAYNTLQRRPASKVVTFESSKYTLSTFLSAIRYDVHRMEKEKGETDISYSAALKQDLSEEDLAEFSDFIMSSVFFSADVSCLVETLLHACLPAEDLLRLCTNAWLRKDVVDFTAMSRFFAVIKAVTSRASSDAMTQLPADETSPWWSAVRLLLERTSHTSSAFSIALLCRSIAGRLLAKDQPSCAQDTEFSVQAETFDIEWEAIHVELHAWDLLVRRLEDATSLNSFLSLGCSPHRAVSVRELLETGRGLPAELLARWAIQNKLDSKMFLNFLETDISVRAPCQDQEPLISTSTDVENDLFNANVTLYLRELRRRFPHSLEKDGLVINLAWELALMWSKELDATRYLAESVAYLELVENAVTLCGLCNLMWQMFFLRRVRTLYALLNKIGRAPKDRLCRKEVGMSDDATEAFMQLVVQFLQLFKEACSACLTTELPDIDVEDFWPNDSTSTSTKSLYTMSLAQQNVNYAMLSHHFHLCAIMHSIFVFGLKLVKPEHAFDRKGADAFFEPLTSYPHLDNQGLDIAVTNSRKNVWSRITTAAVAKLHTKPELTSHWVGLALTVGPEMGVDLDDLRQHYVCQLYAHGHDDKADRLIDEVVDDQLLADQLLLIAGKRVAGMVLGGGEKETSHGVDYASHLSISLLNWLRSLDHTSLPCQDSPLANTRQLLQALLHLLREDRKTQYNQASEMSELLQEL